MRARIRRTIKALDGFLIAFAIRKRPRVAQPQIAGGEDGGDLFDYALRRVLPVFHANLRYGRLKSEDRVGGGRGEARSAASLPRTARLATRRSATHNDFRFAVIPLSGGSMSSR